MLLKAVFKQYIILKNKINPYKKVFNINCALKKFVITKFIEARKLCYNKKLHLNSSLREFFFF